MKFKMNNTLKFTSYILVFSLVWLVGEKFLGYHNTIVDWLPFTSLLWLILVGVFYIAFLRTESATSTDWSFGKGFKSLLKLSVYWLLGFAVIKGIYYQFVNPDYFNDLLLRGREWLTMSATSDENFENATQMMEDLLQLPIYLAVTTAVQFVFCLIYSLLFPAFTKRK
jgi:Ni,Fe-hydrogenase I cytochrome b subunit